MKNTDIRLLYGKLHSFPPGTQSALGIVFLLIGAIMTVLLWNAGWIAGPPLLACGIGVANILLARGRAREKEALDKQIAVLQEREDEIVRTLVDMRRAKQQPFRWLQEAGISDIRIRTYLVKRAEDEDREQR
jgi:hypothetical protein